MAKGYWIATYRSVLDANVFARYASLAGPALEAHGGRFLARGTVAKTIEGGSLERVVIIEFESVGQVIAAYESPEYQAALAVLAGAVERDVWIVEGV